MAGPSLSSGGRGGAGLTRALQPSSRGRAAARPYARSRRFRAFAEIAELIDAAFWASLRHEEGYVSKVSLAFLEPRQAGEPMIFERSIPLEPAALAKVAPAVERAGIHLGVWPDRRRAAGLGHDGYHSRHLLRRRGDGPGVARDQTPPRRGVRQVRERGRARGRSNQTRRRAGLESAGLPRADHVLAWI